MSKSNVQSKFFPPPKGIRLTDPLVVGVPEYALALQNLIPTPQGLIGLPTPTDLTGNQPSIKSLFSYRGTALFTASNTKICALGSTGSLKAITSGLGWACELTTAAGSFLYWFNGVDTPVLYDGAAWSNAAFTGPTLANLFQGVVYRARLYMADKTAQGFWYLPSGAITGAATFYNAGTLFSKGGSVIAMSTLSRDGGAGSDDMFAIWTSGGQVAVFSGNDPGQTTWTVVGVYDIGRPPCGANPQPKVMAKLGGDILCYTVHGIYSLTDIMSGKDVATAASISEPVDPRLTWNMLTSAGSTDNYLDIIKSENLLIVHIVSEDLHVMNLRTGGWCTVNALEYLQTNNWIEWVNAGVITVSAISFGGGLVRRLFNRTAAPGGMMNGTWVVAYPYSRMGQLNRFKVIEMFPWVYYGFASAPTQANTIESNFGVAYDFSGNDQTLQTQTALNSNASDWRSQWAPAGRFYNLWDDDATAGTNKGRVFKSDFTMAAMDYARCASVMLSGNLFTSGNPASVDMVRFSGVDVRYEQELVVGS